MITDPLNSTQNQVPAPSAQQNVVVDSAAIGAAVAEGLLRAGAFQPQAKIADAPSEFDQLLTALKANPDSDQGTINSIAQLFQTFAKDQEGRLTRASEEKLRQSTAKILETTALNTIYQSLDEELKNNPAVHEYRDDIANRVCKAFSSDPKYKDALAKYNNGMIDGPVLRELAKLEVEKFLGVRGGGVVARGPSGGARQATTPSGGGDSNDIDSQVKALAGGDVDFYNHALALQQRVGRPRESKEAKEEALRLTRLKKVKQ